MYAFSHSAKINVFYQETQHKIYYQQDGRLCTLSPLCALNTILHYHEYIQGEQNQSLAGIYHSFTSLKDVCGVF
jgi:hypothetical protein